MKIAVLRERPDGERCVAATPATMRTFIAPGAEASVESRVGAEASDADHAAAGAGRTGAR